MPHETEAETLPPSSSNGESREGSGRGAGEHGAARSPWRESLAGDPRYDLQSVAAGFADRLEERIDENDDAALLERICAAYIKAVKHQQLAPRVYGASDWWEQVRQGNLAPVMRALLDRDIAALRRMYRNFFRDPCSTGLIGAPYGASRAVFRIKDAHRRVYLTDVLYRLDYWMAQTEGRFA